MIHCSRKELGLPIEEPGRYADKSLWGKNPYDPNDPRWRHDYWGDPTNLKDEIRLDREPRVAPTVDESAAAEDIEEVEEEEETEETVDDQSTDVKESTTRANVNGTASAGMDDVRTMFTMQPEVSQHSILSIMHGILCNQLWFSVIDIFSRLLIVMSSY